jgi:DNA-binding PadR family transcriptional regulator
MHPYEVAQTLRSRAKHESIRLNYGSLYGVVELLEKRGFIRARETVREGRRPERTIYEITDTGARELNDWLTDLVAQPVKEYLQFEAALSLLPVLPPDVAVEVLKERMAKLEVQLAQMKGGLQAARDAGIPRLFEIEGEYVEALARAELEFVTRLVKDIESGELDGLDLWHSFLADDDFSWHPPEDPEP